MFTAFVVFVVVAGICTASIVSLIGAHRRGVKKGEARTVERLAGLYRMNRAACEYELLTGQPIESVREQLTPRHFDGSGCYPRSLTTLRRPLE